MSYASVVAGDNPRHWWRFADPGGSFAHDIGSAPFGLAGNGLNTGYSGPSGDGGAFLAAGNSGDGMFSYEPIVMTVPLSVECWFFPMWQKGALQLILGWDNVTNPSIFISWNAAKTIGYAINGVGVLASVNTFASQVWHHVVLVHTGTQILLYVDNVLQNTTANVATPTISRNIGWGNQPSNANIGSMFIADAALYSYALIAAQVANHFNAATARAQAPIYHAPGAFNLVTSEFAGSSADLSSILNAVQKTFPTT
jgi:concanavalin A-like lectin/glucanase superfamily protein